MKVIQLNNGHVAIVDDEDFERIAQYRWHFDGGYAKRTALPEKRNVSMHREIMGDACANKEVDHRNLNKLDNRRENLRAATPAENRRNRPAQSNNKIGLKGVHFAKRQQKYVAQIRMNGSPKHLGYFTTPEAAHSAYCETAERLHGEFVRFK